MEVNNMLIIGESSADVNHNQGGASHVNFYYSPNGTKYWIPDVPSSEKPVNGAVFEKLEDAVSMYEAYAVKAGFDTRLSTLGKSKGATTHRYIVCSKHGMPRSKNVDTMDTTSGKKRNYHYKVTNCKACIKIKALKGTSNYVVYDFVEPHNHGLVSVENRDLMRGKRQLTFTDQEFIHGLQTASLGATVAYRAQTSLKGGQHLVKGTKVEYKNFAKDLRCFIGERDAQMLIDKLNNHKLHFENFFFEHLVVNGEVRSLFWADDISRCNYKVFGDVLAFDATYDTNKYGMIFVPFTGVDHHKKCVTFGAGLLYNETVESYEWILNTFIKAHNKQPMLVLTDQDPAMKKAISTVLTESTHRLCMWHITKKIPVKVCGDTLQNTNLRAGIHKLIWNVFIKPSTFENRWNDLINEFNVGDNKWLNDMYNIRDQWVPAFFRDIPMCCLMKTTSRCESSNSLFKVYSSSGNTLVQFMLCFEKALNAQRYEQRRLQHETITTTPTLLTRLPIERYASYIFTSSIFEEVQKEIYKGLYFCAQARVEPGEGCKIIFISHIDKRGGAVGEFKVTINLNDNSVTCSCMGFTRIGYLCRHIFCVFRTHHIDEIPDDYIPTRWTRDALPSKVFGIQARYGATTDEKIKLRQEATSLFNECADRLRGDTERLRVFVDKMTKMKAKIYHEVPNNPTYNLKSAVIQDLIGCSEPTKITATAPKGIRTKGSGTSRRLIGQGEKAVKKSKKPKRLCHKCNKMTRKHDSRNCEKMRLLKQKMKQNQKQASAPVNSSSSDTSSSYDSSSESD